MEDPILAQNPICSLEEWEQKFMADMPEFDFENYKKNKKEEVLRIVDKFKAC